MKGRYSLDVDAEMERLEQSLRLALNRAVEDEPGR